MRSPLDSVAAWLGTSCLLRPTQKVGGIILDQGKEHPGDDVVGGLAPIEDTRSEPVLNDPAVDVNALVESTERLMKTINSVDRKLDKLVERVESRLDELDSRLATLELQAERSATRKPPILDGGVTESAEATPNSVIMAKDSPPNNDVVDEVIRRLAEQCEATQRMLGKSRALHMSVRDSSII